MKSPVHIADRCGDRGDGAFSGRAYLSEAWEA